MKPRFWLLTVVTFVGLTAQLLADDSSQNTASEKTNPPSGRLTFVAPNSIVPIDAGQFLAGIAYTSQLGIEVAAVEPLLRAHLDLKEGQGVVVTSAANQDGSGQAGLRPHDVVLQIDGHEIASPEKFHELAGSRQGKKVVLQVLRKGKPMELEVMLPNTPVYHFANEFVTNSVTWTDNQFRIGVTLAQADDVLRSQLRLADGEGLVITDIVADGPSAKAGLRKHDVLVKLDGKRLTTVDACNAQIQEIKDRKIAATLVRGGKEISLELAPQLSATAQLTTAPYVSTLLLDNSASADQRWLGRVNLNTTGVDSIHVWPLEVQWHSDLRDFSFTDPSAGGTTAAATASTSPAEQIEQLKRQLAEMQKSLAALESTLQPAKTEQPSQQQPVQKPQQPNDKGQP